MNNLDLIEQLEDLKYHCQDFAEDEMEKEIQPFTDDVKALDQAINELRWIPVDEKLPDEKGKCYLVTLEFRKDGKWQLQKEETLKHFSINRLLFLRNGEWDVWSDNMRVIAWKPLPKPYEKKGVSNER